MRTAAPVSDIFISRPEAGSSPRRLIRTSRSRLCRGAPRCSRMGADGIGADGIGTDGTGAAAGGLARDRSSPNPRRRISRRNGRSGRMMRMILVPALPHQTRLICAPQDCGRSPIRNAMAIDWAALDHASERRRSPHHEPITGDCRLPAAADGRIPSRRSLASRAGREGPPAPGHCLCPNPFNPVAFLWVASATARSRPRSGPAWLPPPEGPHDFLKK